LPHGIRNATWLNSYSSNARLRDKRNYSHSATHGASDAVARVTRRPHHRRAARPASELHRSFTARFASRLRAIVVEETKVWHLVAPAAGSISGLGLRSTSGPHGRVTASWTTQPPARSNRGMLLLFVAIIAAALCAPAHSADVQTITARVVGVHDGDTITALTDDKRQLKVRLARSTIPTRSWLPSLSSRNCGSACPSRGGMT
jgi:hypothetical protein